MKYSLTATEIFLTNREKLLYLAIALGTVFLVSLGVLFYGMLMNSSDQDVRRHQTAVQTTDDVQLNHSIDTKQGYVLAPVTLNPATRVKFPEMNKEFVGVKKTEQTYNRHYRTVCTTDSEGNTTCRQETYYSWDRSDNWHEEAPELDMAGRKYPISMFRTDYRSIDAEEIIDGAEGKYMYIRKETWLRWGDAVGDKRYYYEVYDLPQSGTVFLNLSESVKPAQGKLISLEGKTPQEMVKAAHDSAKLKSTSFVALWSMFVMVCAGFSIAYVYENRDYI